jgi:YbbR domain-containing protein
VMSPPTVRVSGKSSQVEQVKRVVLTLPESATAGAVDDYFTVTALDSKGTSVDGVSLDHERVHLKMDLTEVPATKAVLVSPNVAGEPRYPARVTRVAVSPSSVTLQGKPSALVGVSTLTTDRIPVDDATATIVKDVGLRLPPGVEVAGRDTVRVTVYIAATQ